MVTVAEIKEKLPDWPDEVLGEWLLYIANDIGWPPPEPFGESRWGQILGNRPLSWWAEVTREKENVNCSFDKLSDRTQALVVVDDIRNGTADAVTSRR